MDNESEKNTRGKLNGYVIQLLTLTATIMALAVAIIALLGDREERIEKQWTLTQNTLPTGIDLDAGDALRVEHVGIPGQTQPDYIDLIMIGPSTIPHRMRKFMTNQGGDTRVLKDLSAGNYTFKTVCSEGASVGASIHCDDVHEYEFLLQQIK